MLKIKQQAGNTILVSLMFLIALTILGLTIMQTTTTEERMSSNMADHYKAFESAESALKDAENDIMSSRINFDDNFDVSCTSALCATGFSPSPTSASWSSRSVQYGVFTGAPALSDVASQPSYSIEAIPTQGGPGNSLVKGFSNTAQNLVYKVKAIGYGASSTSPVILEGTFKK